MQTKKKIEFYTEKNGDWTGNTLKWKKNCIKLRKKIDFEFFKKKIDSTENKETTLYIFKTNRYKWLSNCEYWDPKL